MFKKIEDLKGPSIIWIYGIGGFALFKLVDEIVFMHSFGQLRFYTEPPWYSIIHDFIGGVAMLAYFLTCVIVGLIAMRKGNSNGAELIWFSSLWVSVPGWSSLIILLRTKNLFDSSSRTTSWHTFYQYLYDPIRLGGFLILVFIVVVPLLMKKFKWVK